MGAVVGQVIRFTNKSNPFTLDGVLIDPTMVFFDWSLNSGPVTEYIYGENVELVRDSTGVYHIDINTASFAGGQTLHGKLWSTGVGQAVSEIDIDIDSPEIDSGSVIPPIPPPSHVYVVSFNGRSGVVVPQTGDYTPSMVGADPAGIAAGLVGTEQARAIAAEAAAAQKSANLTDLASASAARTALGLGTAATQPSSAFDASGAAASAQGAAAIDATTKANNAISVSEAFSTAALATALAGLSPAEFPADAQGAGLTHSGVGQVIGGVTITAGMRVLDTATGVSSGLWTAASGAWSRPVDFATGSNAQGKLVSVDGGGVWLCISNTAVTVDTTTQVWQEIDASVIQAGAGLTKTGTTISLALTKAIVIATGLTYSDVGADQAGAAALRAALMGVVTPVTSGGAVPVNELTPVNALSAPVPMTLPTGQSQGTWAAVQKTDTSTNAVTISGSIRGVATSITLVLANETVWFTVDSLGSWWPLASHKTLGSLDARYAASQGQYIDRRGADPTYATDSTAAFVACLAAMPTITVDNGVGATATYPVGTIYGGSGHYKIGSVSDIGNMGPFVSLLGPGKNACQIDYYGNGNALRGFNSVRPADNTFDSQMTQSVPYGYAGRFDGFTLDGSHAGPGAQGIHVGDCDEGSFGPDLLVQHFSSCAQMSNAVALTTGAPITSIPVHPATRFMRAGSTVTITDPTNAASQTWTLTADVQGGAITLPVASQTPNFAYPLHSTIMWMSAATTLSSALTTGAPITALPVNATPVALPVDTKIVVISGTNRQNFFLSAAAAAGATSLAVYSQTPTFAFAIGSTAMGLPSVGISFDNTHSWTEEWKGFAAIYDCDTCALVRLSVGGDSSTGYCDLAFHVEAYPHQDGFAIIGATGLYHGSLKVRGNFGLGSAGSTNGGSCLRIGNQTLAGAGGSITSCRVDVQVEADGMAGCSGTPEGPRTISFGDPVNNGIWNCDGMLSWSGADWKNSNFVRGLGVVFSFDGIIEGDLVLNPRKIPIVTEPVGSDGVINTLYPPTSTVFRTAPPGFFDTATGSLDLLSGDVFDLGQLGSNLALVFANGISSCPRRIWVRVKQGGAAFNIVWPSSGTPTSAAPNVLWENGIPPLTGTPNTVDWFELWSVDGATWVGKQHPNALAATAPNVIYQGLLQSTTTTSQSITLLANTTVGDSLLAFISNTTPGSTATPTVTDTQGNTWVIDKKVGSAGAQIWVARALIATALTTADHVTVAWSVSTSAAVQLAQVQGLGAAMQVDQVTSWDNGTVTATSMALGPTGATTEAGELAFLVATAPTINVGNPSWTFQAPKLNPGTPWKVLYVFPTNPLEQIVAYQQVPTPGSQCSAIATPSATEPMTGLIITYGSAQASGIQQGPYIPLPTVTAHGDLIVATGNAQIERLAVGSPGQVLAVGGSDPSGLAWTTLTSSVSGVISSPFGSFPAASSVPSGTLAVATDQGNAILGYAVYQSIANVWVLIIASGPVGALAPFCGDGSDGAVVLDGTTTYPFATLVGSVYTQSREIFSTTLVINAGVTLKPNGWPRYFQVSCVNNGTISLDGGNAAGVTPGAAPGTGGIYQNNVAGSISTTGNGVAGGGNGIGMGNGGTGGAGNPGTASGTPFSARSSTSSFHSPVPAQTGVLAFGGVSRALGAGPGGGSGGGDGTNKGGSGGAPGGFDASFGPSFINNGVMTAKGGNGGTPPAGNCGGGGPGVGGEFLIYTAIPWVNNGTISVASGTPGSGVGTGAAGTAAGTGSVLNVVI